MSEEPEPEQSEDPDRQQSGRPDRQQREKPERQPSEKPELNVLDEPLTPCSLDLETGYERDGYCREILADAGRHEICAVMTEAFLEYTAAQGNDLRNAQPALNFPGLDPGDRWCVCVPRWLEAEKADCAPPVVPEATAKAVLTHLSRDTIEAYAYEG